MILMNIFMRIIIERCLHDNAGLAGDTIGVADAATTAASDAEPPVVELERDRLVVVASDDDAGTVDRTTEGADTTTANHNIL